MWVCEKYRKQSVIFWGACFSLFFASTHVFAVINVFDREVDHPPITILDEQGRHVLESNNPYSPKKTCAGSGCHDYEAITHAYHFEMGRDEASDTYGEKRGLPHLVSPGYYGGYTCMGGNNQQVLAKKNNASPAEFADYGSAGWVKTCMSCHPGGGWAEKDREGIRYDEKKLTDIKALDGDYYERVINQQTGKEDFVLWDWKKSGVGEADCLFCHLKYSKLKLPADSGLRRGLSPRKARGALVEQGFFRQAASGLMEYVKNSDGKHLLSFARVDEQFVLDKNGVPVLNWHREAFNENGRVVIAMLRFPGNDNCMECHLTSNSRRGFYGFGEAAKATLATDGGNEEAGAGGTLEDDYRDDVHKGTNYTDDKGEKRSIESCNACHSSLYYKPVGANIDLDADHNFPKGNSDMDVRNDLDYSPNVKSCEKCHINSINAVVGIKYDSLLHSHTELWKASGDLEGYNDESLTQITRTHFDVVACQTCHIVDKTDGDGKEFQIMYRFRVAEDGQNKISPYNPRVRYYWKDKVSGRVLVKTERNSIFVKANDGSGGSYGAIIDPLTGEVLGRVSGSESDRGFRFNDPDDYASYLAVKNAYDGLLRTKGYTAPDVVMVWTESNEYVISHNTRAAEEAMPCADCHVRDTEGQVSQLISPAGVLGVENSKVVARVPDVRLVTEGIVEVGLSYSKLQSDGRITQNVADILLETSIDPFMSLLKNSSATEITGKFTEITTDELLRLAGVELAELLAPVFQNDSSFIFNINKGIPDLRSMVAVINGSVVNDIVFPAFRGALGVFKGAGNVAQDVLDARGYGQLRSEVYYFDVLDKSKNHITTFNGSAIYIKVPYKGVQTNLSNINIVVADRLLTRINQVPAADVLMLESASVVEDGFVIFRVTELGYFLVADK